MNTTGKRPIEEEDNHPAIRTKLSHPTYIDNDPYSDNTHSDWDMALSKKVVLEPNEYLLAAIVKQCSTLDQTLRDVLVAERLLENNVGVFTELQKACAEKSFKFVRRLEYLQGKSSESVKNSLGTSIVTVNEEMEVTKLAWEAQYFGGSAVLLRDCITDMNYERRAEAYQNFTTIIQSSGTGKSRTVDEMARLLFTLPFNLRNPIESTAYPYSDVMIRDYFRPMTGGKQKESHDDIKMRYLLFFHSLFEIVHRKIVNWKTRASHQEFAGEWREFLQSQGSSERVALYFQAIKDVPNDIFNMKQAIDRARYSARKLLIAIAEKSSEHIHYESEFEPSSPRRRGPVRLFLYFDEAHDLTEDLVDHIETIKLTSTEAETVQQKSAGKVETSQQKSAGEVETSQQKFAGKVEASKQKSAGEVETSQQKFAGKVETSKQKSAGEAETSRLVQRSAYMALCSALSEFEPFDLFTIFLSTNSSLAKFAPTKSLFWSARARDVAHPLQPPFVELPFDVWKGKCIVTEDKHTLMDVCKVKHMVRFGRPLFWTRWEAENSTVNLDMIKFAVAKLRGASEPDNKADGDLAALSVRLLLEFEPQREIATSAEDRLVAGHMRIAFSVPAHREYMRSGTPSEPIVAEAAAAIMNDIENIPKRLLKFVDNGLISKGERGELVARLLLTLAHDAAVKAMRPRRDLSSQPIPVIDFLGALFHPGLMPSIRNSRAQNDFEGPTLEEAFKDAYIHFTHFGKATNDAMMGDESMWFAMARGMAWQCYDRQYSTDILIPILLWNARLGRFVMSVLAIQIKNRRAPRTVRVDLRTKKLPFFTPSNTGNKEQDYKFNTRPYITLVMDVGVQPHSATKADSEMASDKPSSDPETAERKFAPAAPTTTTTPSKLTTAKSQTTNMKLRSSSRPKHPQYVICATGCSPKVYGVIKEDERDIYASLLASRDLLQEHPRQKQQFKDAILRMKPFWDASLASLEWIEATRAGVTNTVLDEEGSGEWLAVGGDAAGSEDEWLLEEL